MMFTTLSKQWHELAVQKGFWDKEVDDIFVAKQLMMIVSEVSEALEAIRKNKGGEEISLEFADIIIRTLDLHAGLVEAGYTTVPLDEALDKKRIINEQRPEKHGVRF